VAISWACRLSVSEYAATGRRAPAPRQSCAGCGDEMAFDGSYPRRVREAGVVYQIFVRRARCSRCGTGHALTPDFVLSRRRDSTAAVGVAVLAHLGHQVPVGATRFYDGVPERTVRSWRQRFRERADVLARQFAALCVEWGDLPPRSVGTTVGVAIQMIGATWRAASGRRPGAMPPAWPMANVILGGQLLGTRVDLPGPISPNLIGHSRAP
jgi:hypothetical protein